MVKTETGKQIFLEKISGDRIILSLLNFFHSVFIVPRLACRKNSHQAHLIFKDSSLSQKITFATDFVNQWSSIYIPVESSYKNFKIPEDVIGVQFSQNGDDGNKHTIYIDDIEFLPAAIDSTNYCQAPNS